MRRFTLALFTLAALSQAAFSQTTVVDSIRTGMSGAAYINDIYYSFKTGQVKSEPNNNWQIALSIGSFNVSIRANTVTSGTADGSVTVYEQPGKDISTWESFDTTGYASWMTLDNSDEDWEMGALNVNAQGQFDYGWGAYDPNTHVISGNTIYLVKIKDSGNNVFKKLIIDDKTSGTWHLRFANIDGSELQTISVNSGDYATKNFAYVSMLTGEIRDREPANTAWDFVLTRYKALQPGGSLYYSSTGILTNMGVMTAEVRGKDKTQTTLADTTETSANISTIGADWKKLNATFTAYDVVDSLSYFVQAVDGAFWKLVFSSFDLANGNTVFNKTKLTPSVGVVTVGNSIKNFVVYPNPSSNVMNVLFDVESENSVVTITDLTGKTLLENTVSGNGFQNHRVDVSNFAKGIYLLNVVNGSSRSVQKIVVN